MKNLSNYPPFLRGAQRTLREGPRGGGFAHRDGGLSDSVEEANSGARRFVQRVKHSMAFWLVIGVLSHYGTLGMTNKIEELDFRCAHGHGEKLQERGFNWDGIGNPWLIHSYTSNSNPLPELHVRCRVTRWWDYSYRDSRNSILNMVSQRLQLHLCNRESFFPSLWYQRNEVDL